MNPGVDVVIVNWNAGDLVRRCIASFAGVRQDGFSIGRVIVVDNASSDGSADGLERDAPVPVTVLRNAENRGFAAACNQGAALSTGAYTLFLNPDTRLFADSLERAVGFLEDPANAGVGVLGIALVDEAGERQRSCARRPTPGRLVAQSVGLDRLLPGRFPPHFMVEWDHADTRDVDQVMGAFLMIRRPVFETVGGFDERFFVYFDDVDLCLSVRLAGWRVVHLAEAAAYHHGCGTTDRVRDLRLFYSLRSRLLFAAKRFSPGGRLAVTAATLLLEPASRVAQALLRGSPRDAAAVLRGTRRLWADLPALLPRLSNPSMDSLPDRSFTMPQETPPEAPGARVRHIPRLPPSSDG